MGDDIPSSPDSGVQGKMSLVVLHRPLVLLCAVCDFGTK